MEFAATTHYHWSNFDGNATQKGEHEIVQGPFQFGLANKLDKTNKEVSVKIIHNHSFFLNQPKMKNILCNICKLCYILRISATMDSNPLK